MVTDGLEAVNDYNVELYDVTNSQILAFKNNITNVPITLDALTVNTTTGQQDQPYLLYAFRTISLQTTECRWNQ